MRHALRVPPRDSTRHWYRFDYRDGGTTYHFITDRFAQRMREFNRARGLVATKLAQA